MDSMDSVHSAVTRDETIALKESEWLSMKGRIATLVEKADASNFQFVADQILSENIVIGKGLFCQAIMKSQSESPESSDVYAALVAVINSKFPQVGYLLVKRAALQFKAAYDRGDKKQMQMTSRFLAQLVNQRVVYEFLAVSVLMFLLVNPSSVNLEVAVSFCTQCGSLLNDVVPRKLEEFLSEFRRLLREGTLEKRVRLSIERLLATKRLKFEDSVINDLDVVDDEDRITHDVPMFQEIDYESDLDRFHSNSEADDEEEDEVSSRHNLSLDRL